MTNHEYNELKSYYENKIKILNEELWEGHATKQKIDSWLANFCGESENEHIERIQALHIISQFMYFGKAQVEALLKALYRDLYRYPIIEKIRKANANSIDSKIIEPLFAQDLIRTRFVSVGGVAESGAHLAYTLRQQTNLPVDLFIGSDQLVSYHTNFTTHKILKTPSNYVFFDDFCGTGDQFVLNLKPIIQRFRAIDKKIKFQYFPLFATKKALDTIRSAELPDKSKLLDNVECVMELDESYKVFGGKSRYFDDDSEKALAKKICDFYGTKMFSAKDALGYGSCELAIGFHHNVPDNSLPIIWGEETGWAYLFKRHHKSQFEVYYG